MNTGERLAAYLSGDLDPDERTALEAELAGDAELRAHLDRIRAADRALDDLPEAELPEGFEDRLRQRLAPELDAVLGDELAARRARRTVPGWLPAVAGAAAALAVVVAGGMVVVGVGGSDSDQAAEDSAAGAEMLEEQGDGGDMADSGGASTMQAPSAGPVVTDRGRTLTSEDLATLATDPDVRVARDTALVEEFPEEAARRYAAALAGDQVALDDLDALLRDDATAADGGGDTTTEDAAATGRAEADEETEAAVPAPAGPTSVVSGPDVDQQDLDAVAACLPVLYDDAAAPVVPLYAELAEAEDGTDVIVYVALAPDAEGSWRRTEVWMVTRDGCDPRLFVQSDGQPAERNAP